jgi:FixJ family two-component response regulator
MSGKSLIAIVDDDAAMRIGLSSLLRSAGYAVAPFDSAEDFLAKLSTSVPECLITDVQMPGIGGLELQTMLKQKHPALAVVMMTAFPEPLVRERALAAGAICFLTKPFDAEELLGCVRRALGQ